jgi:hypothetical protein
MRRKRTAALAAVLVLASALAARANEPAGVSFRVERGDTFTNLFGPDWQKAYEQNRVTVFRQGRPVNSPDVLVEGMVVRVSSDIVLTPRAAARCGALNARRERLSARLSALEATPGGDARAREAAAQTRRLLEDALRFPADVEFAERQVEYLEVLAARPAAPGVAAAAEHDGRRLYLTLALPVCAALACALYVSRRRQRPQYPEADARYRETLADLKAAFRSAGEKF